MKKKVLIIIVLFTILFILYIFFNYNKENNISKNSLKKRVDSYMNVIGVTMFFDEDIDPEKYTADKFTEGKHIDIYDFNNFEKHNIIGKVIPYFNDEGMLSHVIYLKYNNQNILTPFSHRKMIKLQKTEYPLILESEAIDKIEKKYSDKDFELISGVYSLKYINPSYLFKDNDDKYFFVDIESGSINEISKLKDEYDNNNKFLEEIKEETRLIEQKAIDVDVIHFNNDGTAYFDNSEYLKEIKTNSKLKNYVENARLGYKNGENVDVINELIKRGCKINSDTLRYGDYIPECVSKDEYKEIYNEIHEKYINSYGENQSNDSSQLKIEEKSF